MPSKRELTPEEIEALGTIVNDQEPDQETLEIEQKLKLLGERLVLSPSPHTFDRLIKIADFKGVSVEEHCLKVLEDSLSTLIGVPHITGASHYGGTPVVDKKVCAPSPVPLVTRA